MIRKLIFLSTLSLAILTSCGESGSKTAKNRELIVGGDDKVLIIDYDKSNDSIVEIVWELKASEIINLPEDMVKHFRTIDDHKSVDNNSKILISSSSGGVALIDRNTKKCLFYAVAPNAHSIELLPGNIIAIALSTATKGNSLELYSSEESNRILYRDSLFSGHGVTWIENKKRLYALGYDQLREYSLSNWDTNEPGLKLEQEWTLPEVGGHDLFASSDNQLLISTDKHVWSFTIENENFQPFEPIANEVAVKSVYYDEKTGHVIYTKGEISWWTHNIYSLNPDKTIIIPDINVYKARFIN